MVYDKIKKMIAQQFGVDEDSITPETTFEEFSADSLDVVEMIMAIEEEFDIQISDEDVENITDVASVVDYISKKMQ